MHAHFFSRAYVDLLEELGCDDRIPLDSRRAVFDVPDHGIAARLAVMDASGVERQILSMSAATPYLDDPARAVRAARFLNDEHAGVCRTYPDRFGFFATLPMPHIDVALDEIRRAFDDLGAMGATFTTSINARSLADPAFAAVFAELDRRGAVVFLHPPGFACESPIIAESGLTWPLGAPVEDAVCALQLVRADFPNRYPQLKVIVPHLGGFLPFLRYRLDKTAARRGVVTEPPTVLLRKLWYDSANGEPDALALAAKVFGADRILFGSDYPYWMDDSYDHAVRYLEQAGLSADDVAAIQSGNARKLFV
ncbi:MAG TPA: amidohydrolase family protein [Candidatus Lustribacter sp.]|nr:amidohydrolase family protein [Candidatus Lustribacter sp.]